MIYIVSNNKNYKLIELFDYNTVQIIYNDNIDVLKSDTNKNNISSNLGKITTNEGNISSNLGKIDGNIKAIKFINKNSQDNSTDISSNLKK